MRSHGCLDSKQMPISLLLAMCMHTLYCIVLCLVGNEKSLRNNAGNEMQAKKELEVYTCSSPGWVKIQGISKD